MWGWKGDVLCSEDELGSRVLAVRRREGWRTLKGAYDVDDDE
jgi:hypothetical protein